MARLAIYSHAPSDSVNLLKAHLSVEGVDLIKIKRQNSRFAGREGDIIINYGSSSFPMERVGRGRLLNNPGGYLSVFQQTSCIRSIPERWCEDC